MLDASIAHYNRAVEHMAHPNDHVCYRLRTPSTPTGERLLALDGRWEDLSFPLLYDEF